MHEDYSTGVVSYDGSNKTDIDGVEPTSKEDLEVSFYLGLIWKAEGIEVDDDPEYQEIEEKVANIYKEM
jgi:hypothetical protein